MMWVRVWAWQQVGGQQMAVSRLVLLLHQLLLRKRK